MKPKLRRNLTLLFGILACLALAGESVWWASSLMASLFEYRSPLRDRPPQPGSALYTQLSRRVVIVLVDALRLDTSLDPQAMPTLDKLRKQGASATMHSRPPSFSEPGYSTLLVGAWPDINDGPAANLDYPDIPTFTQDNLFSAVHRRGMKTALSGYNWFEKLVPQEAVDASFYTPGEDQFADLEVVNAALPWLDKAATYSLVLIHLDQVDYAGHHEGGPRDPRWQAAARRADDLLRQVAQMLDFRQDTLLVVSDHGQIDPGGHGGDEPVVLTEPFVLVGAGVKPGAYGDVNMVDVAPTVAALLGANLPATSQGEAQLAMLAFDSTAQGVIQAATVSQQEQLLAAYASAIGRPAAAPQAGTVADFQQALKAVHDSRLNSEQLPRSIVALLLALLPAVVLVWKRNRVTFWLAAGALLYALLFNLRYLVLLRKSYSLSSVVSVDDLMSSLVIGALIALGFAWLGVLLGLRFFRLAPRQAALLCLALGLMTIYLLALPVLWSFALNGLLVTWTLPDMPSIFLAFASLMQMAVIGLLAPLLAGVAALIAWIAGFLRQRPIV